MFLRIYIVVIFLHKLVIAIALQMPVPVLIIRFLSLFVRVLSLVSVRALFSVTRKILHRPPAALVSCNILGLYQ